MPIRVLHRQAARKAGSAATVLDLTSRGPVPWVHFSPFFPHGDIPVPRSPGRTAASVEGIWQALKVFEHADVDERYLGITTMRGLKRTVRSLGRVRGHRDGLAGEQLLDYIAARRAIYLPANLHVLEHRLQAEVAELRRLAEASDVVLLDYTTNTNVDDPAKPLSHAGLVMHHVRGTWPSAEPAPR
jgi:hypothetical protein